MLPVFSLCLLAVCRRTMTVLRQVKYSVIARQNELFVPIPNDCELSHSVGIMLMMRAAGMAMGSGRCDDLGAKATLVPGGMDCLVIVMACAGPHP